MTSTKIDATRSYVTVYGITPEQAEDFAFDYDATGAALGSDSLLFQLVPNADEWSSVGWIEVADYDYDPSTERLLVTLETKWERPKGWVLAASRDTSYFQNRLVTMTTISEDECRVGGYACMDGEVLQDKELLSLDADEVARYYDDNYPDHGVDDLDTLLWNAINKFEQVCKDFYLGEDNS